MTEQCKSVYKRQQCVHTRHHGASEHTNGKEGEERLWWNDADVIAELQEKVENLKEHHGLSEGL